MAAMPILEDNHSSNNNHHDTTDAMPPTSSPSPLNQTAAPSERHEPTQLVGVVESAAKTPQGGGQQIATIDHNESNIKLKRCKHGRIKIKDLSKKKLGQSSDIDANSAAQSRDESNNNHIASNNHHEIEKTGTRRENLASKNETTNQCMSKALADEANQTAITPSSSIKDEHLIQKPLTAAKKECPSHNAKLADETSRGHRGRSISRSRSPTRVRLDTCDSPIRRSRYSRSLSSPDRSPSRERSKSSRKRGGKRRRRRRSTSRRYRRSAERSKYPESYRQHRRRSRSLSRSPMSRSPKSRSPRGRDVSASHEELTYRKHRRNLSRTPSRERTNYNRHTNELKYSPKNDLFDRLAQRRSSKANESPTAMLVVARSDRVIVSQEKNSNHSIESESISQISSRPAASTTTTSTTTITTNTTTTSTTASSATATSTTATTNSTNINITFTPQRKPIIGPNFLPKLAQADPDPRENISTRSPMTPSNDDSAASDIYDPEGPVLPISPVESPPMVEKGDDDEVPSSAVQLNQHEKYLQKFHRQERVVEEVKIALKPFYQKRTITKEQYKDVLRKAVPRICHSKTGEINPVKIRSMVDAYVKKMR